MIILFDLQKGDEYALELLQDDINVLCEGDLGLLKDEEPAALQNLIMSNLELIEKDGAKFLTCEHKIFFVGLWQDQMTSKLSKAAMQSP